MLPPRRPKRKRLTVILPTAAVAIVAAAAAFMLSPWLSEAGDADGGDRGTLAAQDSSAETESAPAVAGTTTPAPSASDTTSAAATESEADQPVGDADGDDAATTGGAAGDDRGEPTGGTTTEEGGMVDGSPPNLPDVRGEWYTDAKDRLVSEGWEHVSLVPDRDDPDNGQTECSVLAQDPDPGSPTDYDTPIALTYLEFADGDC
ncbi:PASTA domain-containing protein [Glycomyces sp. NPDC049804]|uniref:PASTA domain-containing protein n=1 Tax=Glycomyces sp. NPDC049804 TaxID=3154363 RepID=UPI00343FED48